MNKLTLVDQAHVFRGINEMLPVVDASDVTKWLDGRQPDDPNGVKDAIDFISKIDFQDEDSLSDIEFLQDMVQDLAQVFFELKSSNLGEVHFA